MLFAQEAGRQQPLKVDERTVLELIENAESIQLRDGSVIDLRALEFEKGLGKKLDSLKGLMQDHRKAMSGGTGDGAEG